MSTLKFGWAETSSTPNKRISLAGQFAERISQYVEKPLTATALAVDSGREQMILVSCDLVHIDISLVEAVRSCLQGNKLGIDPDKLIISAIHTHTGPVVAEKCGGKAAAVSTIDSRGVLKSMLPEGRNYIERAPLSTASDIASPDEMFDLLVDRITSVCLQAWNSRTNGAFSNAFGRAAVGLCRRAVYSDGSAQMWGDTNTASFQEIEAGSDSGIELLYVFDENEKLKGIVANLACPAQCVQHRHFVSPDFWGEVKVLLRRYFGDDVYLLPLCSAAGDQCPVDLVRWVEPESDLNDPNCARNNPLKRKADPSMFDLSGMRKIGKRIAREIIDVWEDGIDAPSTACTFEHKTLHVPLPLRRVTLADVEKAKKSIRDYIQNTVGDVDYNDAAKLQPHIGVLRRAELQDKVDVLKTEVHIIRLGSIAIATNPFELFLNYGNQIKARSKAEQTFLVQLANGNDGYLPTLKAEQGGHYSGFVASGTVGHEGGDLLVRQTLQTIANMFTE